MSKLSKSLLLLLMAFGLTFTSCTKDDEAPEEENEEEMITDVTLIFTNTADATDVVTARAKDPDGEGVQDIQILDAVNLKAGTTYELSLDLLNGLETPPESISEEVEAEGDEHQFFFAFSNDAFTSPAGNGNIDNAADAVGYADMDENGDPIGLITTWTTSANDLVGGEFRVRLQHQPDVKTSTSTAQDGDTDIDLTFVLNIAQ